MMMLPHTARTTRRLAAAPAWAWWVVATVAVVAVAVVMATVLLSSRPSVPTYTVVGSENRADVPYVQVSVDHYTPGSGALIAGQVFHDSGRPSMVEIHCHGGPLVATAIASATPTVFDEPSVSCP